MKNPKRFLNGRSFLCALLALMMALPLLVTGCTVEIRTPGTVVEQTETPKAEEPAATPIPAPTPVPTPTPEPISFAVPDEDAVEAYMNLGLCQPIENAISQFGDPRSIFGQNAYAYKAVAGGADSENALVYRFMEDSVGIELIVSQEDGRILKKQISSPDAFPRLLDDASGHVPADGTPYADLLSALGTDPYLWMSFVAPNAHTDEGRYEVCLWPDKEGQLVAVVQNGIVLRSEYQPEDTVLMAAAVDGVTPRVPRYLKPKPENANKALSKYDPFEKFEDLHLGQSETDIADKLGAPAAERTEGNFKVLTYEYSDPDFSGGMTRFEYYVTTDASAVLVMKSVFALPSGGEEVRGRYAPQMLPGMTLDDIEGFMGKPLQTNKSYVQNGEETSYSYVGYYGCATAVFQTLGGQKICVRNESVVTDAFEEKTLYEEYVLPVKAAKPSEPTPQPTFPNFTFIPITIPPVITPAPTLIPLPSYPIITFIIPTFVLQTPKPTPTPTAPPVIN